MFGTQTINIWKNDVPNVSLIKNYTILFHIYYLMFLTDLEIGYFIYDFY
jgi:hypothetical protein